MKLRTFQVGGSDQFKYTKDHSKYGRTLDAKDKVVCIGDINRMVSIFSIKMKIYAANF